MSNTDFAELAAAILGRREGMLALISELVLQNSHTGHKAGGDRVADRLSIEAAGRYIRTYRGPFSNSSRVAAVSRYSDTIQRLLRHSPIAGVPNLVGEPARNYVLQFDTRYARMWSYYDRLRRQED